MPFVKCKFCGMESLRWQKGAVDENGKARWQLLEPSGLIHICVGRQQSEERVKQFGAESAVPEVPQDQQAAILKLVSSKIDSRLADWMLAIQTQTADLGNIQRQVEKVQHLGSEMDSMLTDTKLEMKQRKAEIIEASREMAIKTIKEMYPVEHHLVVHSNGHDRKLSGHVHKYLPTLIQVASQRLHVFMVGPAGSGKTTAGQQLAEALGLKFYEASMGPATSQWDLLGFRNATGQYVPGILREPYENGGVALLDELDNSNPSVITTLNSGLSNKSLTFPDKRIEKHKDFICVAAGNTYGMGADRMYVGRNQLDAASLDRFVVIDWDYDEDAERDWAGADQIEWTEFVQKVRKVVFEQKMRVVVSPRASIFGAALLRAGVDRDVVAKTVLWKGMSKDDLSRIREALR